jgi:hypothetical protein
MLIPRRSPSGFRRMLVRTCALVVQPSRRLLSPFGPPIGYVQSWDGWNGRSYTAKQVHPIFVDEAHEIVVVTVYVYYCSEGRKP